MFFFKVKYYTCIDSDRCGKIMTVYGGGDATLYQRKVNDIIPNCFGMSSPPPGMCTVCNAKNITVIVCNEALPTEGEDNYDFLPLKEIPPSVSNTQLQAT